MTDRGGQVTAVARDFEARLAQREAVALQTMQAGYTSIVEDLRKELTGLENRILARIADGKDVPVSWLHKDARYRSLVAQSRDAFSAYGGHVTDTVKIGQDSAIALAKRGSIEMLQTQLGTSPETQRVIDTLVTIPDGAIRQITATTKSGPLADLLGSFGSDAANAIANELTNGIAKGLHPSQIMQNVLAQTDLAATRAALITRNEMYRSFREANRSTFVANDDVVDNWIWFAHLGSKTCAACLAMNGTVHSVHEPMGSHPGCRCTMLPQTKSWEELGFSGIKETRITPDDVGNAEEWLTKQPEKDQLAAFGGNKKLFRGWYEGDFDLQDVVRTVTTPEWGTTRTISGYDAAKEHARARSLENQRLAEEKRKADEAAAAKPKATKAKPVTWDEETRTLIGSGIRDEAHAREVGKKIRENAAEKIDAIRKERENLDATLEAVKANKKRFEDAYRTARQKAWSDGATEEDRAYSRKLRDRIQEQQDKVIALETKRAKLTTAPEYRKALQKVRPGFGKGSGDLTTAYDSWNRDRSDAGYIKLLQSQRENLPAEWWDDIKTTPIRAKKVDRGYFSEENERYHGFVDVAISGKKGSDSSKATSLHELVHFTEFKRPDIYRLEREFYARRTSGEALAQIPGHRADEVARADKFVHPYIGKEYAGKPYTEVASMGIESLFHETHWGNVVNDVDMLDFILGILAGA